MPNDVLPEVRSERDAKGRWLVAPPHVKPWKPGESGNPSGAGGEYHKAVKLARSKSQAVVERMVELAELNNVEADGKLAPLSRKADARVAALASQWLWEVAWGKNRSPMTEDPDKPGVTIEQRRDEAMATLMAAFDRVLAASKAQQPAPNAVDGMGGSMGSAETGEEESSNINDLDGELGG